MKNLITLVFGLFICLQGVATDKTNSMVVKGQIREVSGIDYQISLINADSTETIIKSDRVYKFYKICFEVGRNYKVTFCKDDIAKTLIVSADATGLFNLDVDFTSTNNARLYYDYIKHRYRIVVVEPEYAEN